jgi:hypothetical protein
MNSTRFYWCVFLTQQPEEQLAAHDLTRSVYDPCGAFKTASSS